MTAANKKSVPQRLQLEHMRCVFPNAAGLDIGSAEIVAALPPDRGSGPVRSFTTFTPDLKRLVAWLVEHGIDTVAMESMGIYWVPIYEMLEQAGLQVFLVNPHYRKIVPGRKSDYNDAQWLQRLHSLGLLQGSFRPDDEMCTLRSLHMLVTAGGLAPDGQSWVDPKHPRFLVPDPALSVIFRAKFCAGLKKAGLLRFVPAAVWKIRWIVHSQHAGRGDTVLDYLARYVFRIAIANSRLESLVNDVVRFRYRDNKTQQIRHVSLPATEFIHRFLQHVLPKSVTKVRYYGLFSPVCCRRLDGARQLLSPAPGDTASTTAPVLEDSRTAPVSPPPRRCPLCQNGILVLLETLPSRRSRAP